MKTMQIIISIVLLFAVAFTLTGCYEPVSEPVIVGWQNQPLAAAEKIAGNSVENRPIKYFELGSGNDTTLIIATIHGNEPAGTPLVRKLVDYLRNKPDIMTGRHVIALPVANPDGMANNTRYNARDIDLNRNFDALNRENNSRFGYEALSEPEARAIKRLIDKYRPDRIVSIHQPYACIDYDGPGENLALRMSQYCDLPVRKLGGEPGSLGSCAGIKYGIPIITLELPANAQRLDRQALWDKYGMALVAAIMYPEKIN